MHVRDTALVHGCLRSPTSTFSSDGLQGSTGESELPPPSADTLAVDASWMENPSPENIHDKHKVYGPRWKVVISESGVKSSRLSKSDVCRAPDKITASSKGRILDPPSAPQSAPWKFPQHSLQTVRHWSIRVVKVSLQLLGASSKQNQETGGTGAAEQGKRKTLNLSWTYCKFNLRKIFNPWLRPRAAMLSCSLPEVSAVNTRILLFIFHHFFTPEILMKMFNDTQNIKKILPWNICCYNFTNL